MSRQRAIAANFDQQLRCPPGMDGGRAEGGCVVCARRFWLSELYPMVLFQSPEADLSTIEVPSGAETIAPSQQQRLCRLLGIDRYAERWPHIDRCELKASAVEHPYIPGEFLLLHRRRMPASSRIFRGSVPGLPKLSPESEELDPHASETCAGQRSLDGPCFARAFQSVARNEAVASDRTGLHAGDCPATLVAAAR